MALSYLSFSFFIGITVIITPLFIILWRLEIIYEINIKYKSLRSSQQKVPMNEGYWDWNKKRNGNRKYLIHSNKMNEVVKWWPGRSGALTKRRTIWKATMPLFAKVLRWGQNHRNNSSGRNLWNHLPNPWPSFHRWRTDVQKDCKYPNTKLELDKRVFWIPIHCSFCIGKLI